MFREQTHSVTPKIPSYFLADYSLFFFFLSFEARLFLQTFRRELANVATVRTRIQKRSLGAVILLLVCV